MGTLNIGSDGSVRIGLDGSIIFNAEWIPTNIGGCVLWLRSDYAYEDAAGTDLCENNDLVWVGVDQSEGGNNISQATESKRPIYLTNQINGHPAWRLDGTDDDLRTSAFTWNDPEVIYIVFKPITWADGDYICDGIADNLIAFAGLWGGIEPRYSIYPSNEYNVNYIQCATGVAVIVRITWNGANKELRKNNESGVAYTGSATNAGGFTLGSYGGQGGGFINIDFVEVFGYSAIPTASEDTAAMNYLNARYAIY